ncbi:unnamed protein product [Cylindrotheca closterium]|uniref:F-box domain-containing protein n=1 Tax=Cylindrotheca closterium TaxID=2856 RepID=A0AAD2JN82_9STRA|nr:unnamed protein product [Cylindrotheca closterium]
MFTETFLQAKNQDCLEQVLSFLACKELANVGRTSKSLHHSIFEANETEGNVSMIWQGAEQALTNPGRDKREFFSAKTQRIGSNAREHCRLFATASKAAKVFEMIDEMVEEEDRVMVDGVLANLMNVRDHDAKNVAEKKAIGAKDEQKTLEEGASEQEWTRVEMDEDFAKSRKEKELRREERINELRQLSPPDAPDNHEVFVRITRASSGEVISQGFCGTGQKFPWWFGLDIGKEAVAFGPPQGFQIFLDFESLKQSEEMQSFQEYYSEPEGQHGDNSTTGFMTLGFNMTALIIDKRNYKVHCLFQHDQTEDITCRRSMNQSFGFTRDLDVYEYRLNPKWGHAVVQLGPSMCDDRYYLSYSLSLYVAHLKNGGCLFLPSLDVDISPDSSVWNLSMQRLMESDSSMIPSASPQTTNDI